MPVFTTACPRNCYSTCSMKVEVENGKLRFIEANPANRATSEGICLKGLSYIERVNSPDRLLYPLKKNGKNGRFNRISWTEAISEIAEKLHRFKNDFGPKSVFYYSASGTKGLLNEVGLNFWKLFGGCTTTYGDLCWPAGLEATRLTLGENKHNVPCDLENAKLIIMWGKNAAETNIHQMLFVENAQRRGAKLVVIDPRRTPTSNRAELLIQPRPGTDGALALGLCNYLIKNKYTDDEFIKKYVFGFSEFAGFVKEYTTEKVAEICQIPVSLIVRLGELIGEISPLTICAGFGMQRYTNSGQTIRAIIAINAITGNIGKQGAGWQYANLQSHIFNNIKDPVASYPPEKANGKIRISVSTSLLGEELAKTEDPPIKMIWVERGNPITQNPDTNLVLQEFRKTEFVVVVDQFLTDTAREADIVLPAKSFLEQSDIINAYWHPYIQLVNKVLEPPEEVKPETEIYYALAKQLGMTDAEIDGKIPLPGEDAVIEFLKNRIKKISGLSFEMLQDGPQKPPDLENIAFENLHFPTPSGKIELLSQEAGERWKVNPLPGFTEATETILPDKGKNNYFFLLTPNTKNRIHSQFNNLEMIRQVSPGPAVHIHPKDAIEYKIENQSKVRIFNERGEITISAQIDAGIKRGCISVTNGWWIGEGGNVNFTSLGRETDMGHGAAFHDNRVKIEKVK